MYAGMQHIWQPWQGFGMSVSVHLDNHLSCRVLALAKHQEGLLASSLPVLFCTALLIFVTLSHMLFSQARGCRLDCAAIELKVQQCSAECCMLYAIVLQLGSCVQV